MKIHDLMYVVLLATPKYALCHSTRIPYCKEYYGFIKLFFTKSF